MELYQAQDNFIILNGPDSLWCNRLDGRLQPRFGKKRDHFKALQIRRSLSLIDCYILSNGKFMFSVPL